MDLFTFPSRCKTYHKSKQFCEDPWCFMSSHRLETNFLKFRKIISLISEFSILKTITTVLGIFTSTRIFCKRHETWFTRIWTIHRIKRLKTTTKSILTCIFLQSFILFFVTRHALGHLSYFCSLLSSYDKNPLYALCTLTMHFPPQLLPKISLHACHVFKNFLKIICSKIWPQSLSKKILTIRGLIKKIPWMSISPSCSHDNIGRGICSRINKFKKFFFRKRFWIYSRSQTFFYSTNDLILPTISKCKDHGHLFSIFCLLFCI